MVTSIGRFTNTTTQNRCYDQLVNHFGSVKELNDTTNLILSGDASLNLYSDLLSIGNLSSEIFTAKNLLSCNQQEYYFKDDRAFSIHKGSFVFFSSRKSIGYVGGRVDTSVLFFSKILTDLSTKDFSEFVGHPISEHEVALLGFGVSENKLDLIFTITSHNDLGNLTSYTLHGIGDLDNNSFNFENFDLLQQEKAR